MKHCTVPMCATTILLTVLVLGALTATAAGKHSVFYRQQFASLGDNVFIEGSQATNQTRSAVHDQLVQGTTGVLVDFGQYTPPAAPASAAPGTPTPVVSIPFAVAGLAICFHIPDDVRVEFTVAEFGRMLRGDASWFAVKARRNVRLVLSRDQILLKAVAYQGSQVNTTVYSEDFVAVVSSNVDIAWVDTDEEAVSYVQQNPYTATLASYIAAVTHHLSIVGLIVPHPKYKEHGLHVATYPNFEPSMKIQMGLTADKKHTQLTSTEEPLYPFTIPGIMSVSTKYACQTDAGSWFTQGMHLVTVSWEQWHILHFPYSVVSASLLHAVETSSLCTSSMVITGKGSSAIAPLVTALSSVFSELRTKSHPSSPPPMILYNPVGSGKGMAALLASPDLPFAGTDSASDSIADPGVRYLPVTSFAVGLAINLPGVGSVVMPRCTLLGIFTGKVQYWDDPAILRYNPTVLLPKRRIFVWVRSGSSGTTGIVTRGLTMLALSCPKDASGFDVVETNTWTNTFDHLEFATSSSKLLDSVGAQHYSIGYADANSIKDRTLTAVTLVDEKTSVVTSTGAEYVQQALESATVSPKLTITLPSSSSAYPFIGVSYLAYHKDVEGNCSQHLMTSEYMKWIIVGNEAVEHAAKAGYVSLPARVVDLAHAALHERTCDGNVLLPTDIDVASSSDSTTLVIAVVVPLLIVILGGVGGFLYVGSNQGKDNSCAPKDDSAPYTIMFTDIESSTSLWARAGDIMGPALDAHNTTIRASIKKHKCYEVKTIGDAFMVACPSPEVALQLAADIQLGLHRHKWPSAGSLNSLYGELHREQQGLIGTPGADLDNDLWNGLRVRVGIAYGEAAARLDEVSGGYDYFGSTVNMAARVEAVGHGGQTVVTDELLKRMDDKWLNEHHLVATSLGGVQLKGFEGSTTLHQLLPSQLEDRTFPKLRADVETAEEKYSNTLMSEDHTQFEAGEQSDTSVLAPMQHPTKFSDSKSPEQSPHLPSSPLTTHALEESLDNPVPLPGSAAPNAEVHSTTDGGKTANNRSFFSSHRYSQHDDRKSNRAEYISENVDVIECMLAPVDSKERKMVLDILCRTWRVNGSGPHTQENLARRILGVLHAKRHSSNRQVKELH